MGRGLSPLLRADLGLAVGVGVDDEEFVSDIERLVGSDAPAYDPCAAAKLVTTKLLALL